MIKIEVNPQYAYLRYFIETIPCIFEQQGVIDYSGRNTIKVIEHNGLLLNIKSFKVPHLVNRLVYTTFRKSKAMRAYEYGCRLIEKNINTPYPVAYIEIRKGCLLGQSFYISIHEKPDGMMREFYTGSLAGREDLLSGFAAFTADLHSKNILHQDYSPGNILYKKDTVGYSFMLVDINRMRFDQTVTLEEGCANLSRLWGNDEMISFIAKEYAKARKFDENKCISVVLENFHGFWTKNSKKHPQTKPYINIDNLKIGFDAKRYFRNFTGLGNYSRFVVNNLAKLYPENEYILFTEKEPTTDKKQTEALGIKINIKKSSSLIWRTFGITKDIKNSKSDIYHGLSNEVPYKVNETSAKSIVTIHDLIFLRYPQYYPVIDRIIYDIKAKYACKQANRIVAVSQRTKDDIVEYYKTDPDKIDVVYQGCFPIFKEPVSEKNLNEVKSKYNLPDKFILSIGSIEERKNILLIAKALKYVPDIKFIAIGKKRKYAESVLKYASENGLSDRIQMLENIPLNELPAFLKSATIFVYPSLYEGFGIPIIEALNIGVPIIAATGSCLEEAGGPNSIYVNPHNEIELVEAINKILNDSDLQKNMIEQGRRYVQRFSEEKCIASILEVYKKTMLAN